ncbi:hypothetical protein AMECASPLE_016641, partial [Ameca splendens]
PGFQPCRDSGVLKRTACFSGAPDISCGRFTQRIMAQTNSSGQGTNGVADESPNTIVYRK